MFSILKTLRINLIIIPAILLVNSLSGCDFVYRILQKEGAEEKELLGKLIPREYNEKVEKVQKLLRIYGYKAGRIDGVLGANTRNAIKEFLQSSFSCNKA